VLAYHGIDDSATFERHLQVLGDDAHPVTLAEVTDAIAHDRSLPPGAVLLTFDDGARSLFDLGLPLLRRYRIPAVAFVVAGLLGTDRPFWWDEVKQLVRLGGRAAGHEGVGPEDTVRRLKQVPNEDRLAAIRALRSSSPRPAAAMPQLTAAELLVLQSAGVAIGNHSLTHPCLTRCDAATIEAEMAASQRILADALGRPPDAHAYPNGDADERVEAAARHFGFKTAFLFDHRLAPSPPSDPLRISRVRVNSTTSVDRLRTIVSGLHPAIHRLRGRR